MRDKIAAGTTSYMAPIYATNSSTGAGLGSLVFNSSGLVGEYRRAGSSTWTSISLSAGTLGTYSSGSWILDGSLVGAYEVGIPNAALATGEPWVVIRFYGAASMTPVLLYYELDAVNYQLADLGFSGVALPTAPVANSIGEAWFAADITLGRIGVAQGGTSTTITLDAGASSDTNAYVGDDIYLYGGTGGGIRGSGQRRTVISYNTSTKVATVQRAWDTTPDSTTKFMTLPQTGGNVLLWDYAAVPTPNVAGVPIVDIGYFSGVAAISGTAQGGTSNTITLASSEPATNNYYQWQVVGIASGTGAGQSAIIGGYVGSTKVATILGTWAITPDATSKYVIGSSALVNAAAWGGTTIVATSLPVGTTAGAAGGLFIAGTNAATTVTTAFTTTFTGNLTGSVGSVTGAVGSVTGAVGSVTGNVGGNVVGSVGSVTGLTTTTIATAVWQDTTSGDFTTAGSIGHALFVSAAPGVAGGHFIAGTNAATTITTGLTTTFTGNLTGSVGSVTGAVGSVTGAVGSVTGLTPATIATQVWQDTTAGDFTTVGSPGKVVVGQLGGAFTTTSSSVYSTASLANAPTGGSAPTASQIATAVWQDVTAGDFTVSSSIGKALYLNAAPGAAGGHFIAGSNAATTVNITGNLSGSVGSVTGLVTANVTQWGGASLATPNVPGVPLVDIGYFAGAPAINGTAQSGTSNTITLASSEPAVNNYYQWQTVGIVAGTGSGQSRLIIGYVGSTQVATVNRAWIVDPDDTSKYVIGASAEVNAVVGGAPFPPDTASGFGFLMVLSIDHISPAIGATVTAQVSIAGGAFQSTAGTVTEIGNGGYYFSGAAADFNGASVLFRFTATLADPVVISLNTST